MPINSKQKGKRGELVVAHAFQKYGFEANRTAQCRGNTGQAPDVEVKNTNLHVEVKFQNKMHLYDWMEQADRDCEAEKKNNIPVVIHKANNKPMLVSMHFEDFMEIYMGYLDGQKTKT